MNKKKLAAGQSLEFPAFLYVLEDPRTPGNIRYVGLSQSLPQRLTTHFQRAKEPASPLEEPLYSWFRGLILSGNPPRMRVLWQGTRSQAEVKEIAVIEGYRRLGFQLLNQSDGGSGNRGWVASPEARQRMSLAGLGKPKPAGHGEAVSRASLGRKKSPEHVAALRLAWRVKAMLKHSRKFFGE